MPQWHGIRTPSAMQDYSNYAVKDFVLDESFQQWVLNPKKESDLFWKKWVTEHQKVEIINEARYIVENLKFSNYRLSGKNVKELWVRIKKQHSSNEVS